MTILPVLRQSGHIKKHHRLLDSTQNLIDDHPSHRRSRRIPSSEVRLCFAGAGFRGLAPVSATETKFCFNPFSKILIQNTKKYGIDLHVMGGGDSEEEDGGFGRIDVEINPSAPGGEAFVIGQVTIHVLHYSVSVLNVIPPGLFFVETIRIEEEEEEEKTGENREVSS